MYVINIRSVKYICDPASHTIEYANNAKAWMEYLETQRLQTPNGSIFHKSPSAYFYSAIGETEGIAENSLKTHLQREFNAHNLNIEDFNFDCSVTKVENNIFNFNSGYGIAIFF